jgi:crossover junction endodeoxyribonuclease RusA
MLLFHTPDQEPFVRFTVPGEPLSKARARVVRGRAYTPTVTRLAEARVQAEYLAAVGRAWAERDDIGFAVAMRFHAFTRQRRDVDNMVKLVLDGLNKLAWADDAQVMEIHASKVLVDDESEARTEVELYELPLSIGVHFVCEQCGKQVRTYRSSQRRRYCNAGCQAAARAAKKLAVCPGCQMTFTKPNSKAVYCSVACNKAHRTITMRCLQCATQFTRPQSWATNGKPMCSPECRAAYWRENKASHARGVCATCGGPTSKKSYTRCRPCIMANRTPS